MLLISYDLSIVVMNMGEQIVFLADSTLRNKFIIARHIIGSYLRDYFESHEGSLSEVSKVVSKVSNLIFSTKYHND